MKNGESRACERREEWAKNHAFQGMEKSVLGGDRQVLEESMGKDEQGGKRDEQPHVHQVQVVGKRCKVDDDLCRCDSRAILTAETPCAEIVRVHLDCVAELRLALVLGLHESTGAR